MTGRGSKGKPGPHKGCVIACTACRWTRGGAHGSRENNDTGRWGKGRKRERAANRRASPAWQGMDAANLPEARGDSQTLKRRPLIRSRKPGQRQGREGTGTTWAEAELREEEGGCGNGWGCLWSGRRTGAGAEDTKKKEAQTQRKNLTYLKLGPTMCPRGGGITRKKKREKT